MKKLILTVAFALAGGFGLSADAQISQSQKEDLARKAQEQQAKQEQVKQEQLQAQSKETLKKIQDVSALNKLHYLNQKEIEASSLALKQAQSPEVKDLARTILQEHQANESQVQQLAKQSGVKLGKYQPSSADKATLDELKKIKGPTFDQAFTEIMADNHALVAQELDSYEDQLDNPDLRSFINKLIPKIREHGSQARNASSG